MTARNFKHSFKLLVCVQIVTTRSVAWKL